MFAAWGCVGLASLGVEWVYAVYSWSGSVECVKFGNSMSRGFCAEIEHVSKI